MTQTSKMSLWGIGPMAGIVTAVYGIVAVVATYAWRPIFSIDVVPYRYLMWIGLALLLVGLPLLVVSGRTITKAHGRGELVTTGPYAVCRNPLYAIWILLVIPALGLLFGSWLLLTTSVVMYVAVRILVCREEEYLEEQFGREYRDYKSRTGAILPTLWKR